MFRFLFFVFFINVVFANDASLLQTPAQNSLINQRIVRYKSQSTMAKPTAIRHRFQAKRAMCI